MVEKSVGLDKEYTMAKEVRARIKIYKILEDAGWRFFDNENSPANIKGFSRAKK